MFAFRSAETHANADTVQNVTFNKEMWRKLVFQLKMLKLSTWNYILYHKSWENCSPRNIQHSPENLKYIISSSATITENFIRTHLNSKCLHRTKWESLLCCTWTCAAAMWNFVKMINFDARNCEMNCSREAVVTKSHRSQFLFIGIILCDFSFLSFRYSTPSAKNPLHQK